MVQNVFLSAAAAAPAVGHRRVKKKKTVLRFSDVFCAAGWQLQVCPCTRKKNRESFLTAHDCCPVQPTPSHAHPIRSATGFPGLWLFVGSRSCPQEVNFNVQLGGKSVSRLPNFDHCSTPESGLHRPLSRKRERPTWREPQAAVDETR